MFSRRGTEVAELRLRNSVWIITLHLSIVIDCPGVLVERAERTPIAVEPSLIASREYSTWKRRPSGEKVLSEYDREQERLNLGLTH